MALKLRICKWRYPWQNISFSHLKSKISLLHFFPYPSWRGSKLVMGSKNDIIALKLFILDLSRVVGVHFKRKQDIWFRAHIFFLNVVTIDNFVPLSKWRSTFLFSFEGNKSANNDEMCITVDRFFTHWNHLWPL